MSPLTGALIIACGISAVIVSAWAFWAGVVKPWLQKVSDDLRLQAEDEALVRR
jgi:hypothetical protein